MTLDAIAAELHSRGRAAPQATLVELTLDELMELRAACALEGWIMPRSDREPERIMGLAVRIVASPGAVRVKSAAET